MEKEKMSLTLDVLQPKETWNINDPSKISEFMRCPRKYFYRYMLDWASSYPNNDLIFGTAWHLSAENFLLNGYTNETLYESSRLFLEEYRKHFDESTDSIFAPKNPSKALEALALYAEKFQDDSREYEVLHTEIGGVVSVSGTNNVYFKIDAIRRNKETNKVSFLDHKTSKYKSYDWGDHWILSTQMNTYTHVLNCLYPRDEVEGGKVRGTFFYKAKPNEFDETSVERSPNQMNAWLTRINSWLERIEKEKEILMKMDSPSLNVMMSFPLNDTACFDFGRKCLYFDLCNSWSNPLQHLDFIPSGIEVKEWNPMDQPNLKVKVDLT